jgi:hypothetical protein
MYIYLTNLFTSSSAGSSLSQKFGKNGSCLVLVTSVFGDLNVVVLE